MPQLPAFMAAVAPSRSAGRHAMRDYDSDLNPPRSSPYTAPSVTPYLGLRARLSQVWINRWTILLILVLARTLIALAGIDSDLGSARREALSACSSVESMGSAMASMPHYMSQGVNELTAAGIEKSVNALMQTSLLALTGVEEIVVFVINMLTSTYLCLITFAVTGSAKVVIDAIEEAQQGLNSLTQSLGDDMANVIKEFNDAYDKVKETLSGKTLGISTGIDLPDLNVNDDIEKLRNLELPPGLGADLEDLKNNLPDFKTVQNFTDNLIRLPFEEVKKLVNESLGTYTFDRSVFPVPPKEQLSFCSDDDGINGFFDALVDIASVARKVFIGVLLAAAILVCIPMAWREIKRWQTMKERSQLVGSGQRDPMDVVYIVSRPYTASMGLKASNASRSERRQTLIRWVVAYATSEAALFVLCLAIAGLFSCLCQYILVKSLEKEVPALTAHVGGFADKVISQLNNASEQWAISTNAVITDTNTTINDDLFGWVNTSTVAVNDTLNQFVDLTTDALDKAFGGTPLRDPVQEVLNCLVVFKVQGIQKGLTWVHDNAHISLPLMRSDMFSLGAAASIASDQPADQSFLANPGDEAADKISSAVARFLNKFKEGIRVEAIISTVVLMLWFFILLIGVVRALTLWFGTEKLRGEGGAAPFIIPSTPINPGTDFRSDDQDRYRFHDDIPMQQARNEENHYTDPGLPAYTKEAQRPTTAHGRRAFNGSIIIPKRQKVVQHSEDPYWESDNKI